MSKSTLAKKRNAKKTTSTKKSTKAESKTDKSTKTPVSKFSANLNAISSGEKSVDDLSKKDQSVFDKQAEANKLTAIAESASASGIELSSIAKRKLSKKTRGSLSILARLANMGLISLRSFTQAELGNALDKAFKLKCKENSYQGSYPPLFTFRDAFYQAGCTSASFVEGTIYYRTTRAITAQSGAWVLHSNKIAKTVMSTFLAENKSELSPIGKSLLTKMK